MTSNQTLVAVALISATPGTLGAILGYFNAKALRGVKHAMNSLLDERVEDAGKIGHAKGVADERNRERL